MGYREYQKQRWDSLATLHGATDPLKAVVGEDNDLTNYYFDKTTKRLLSRTIRRKRTRSILDVGCGLGRLSLWLAPRVKTIIGVDISSEMISVAKRRTATLNLPNAEFLVTDGRTLPFEDDHFDLIICIGTLKYVMDDDDLSLLIGEMCRVLAPGGHIAVIEQIDYNGPIALHGKEDIGGESLLRTPNRYISLFEECNMRLDGHYSLYRKLLFNRYTQLVHKIGLGRYIQTLSAVSKLVMDIDARLDSLLRRGLKGTRGFHLLYFHRTL
jgi:ubiquinone/menaquinone biosynthesis C-methylase UbiE